MKGFANDRKWIIEKKNDIAIKFGVFWKGFEMASLYSLFFNRHFQSG